MAEPPAPAKGLTGRLRVLAVQGRGRASRTVRRCFVTPDGGPMMHRFLALFVSVAPVPKTACQSVDAARDAEDDFRPHTNRKPGRALRRCPPDAYQALKSVPTKYAMNAATPPIKSVSIPERHQGARLQRDLIAPTAKKVTPVAQIDRRNGSERPNR